MALEPVNVLEALQRWVTGNPITNREMGWLILRGWVGKDYNTPWPFKWCIRPEGQRALQEANTHG